jgi:hypothetical protein
MSQLQCLCPRLTLSMKLAAPPRQMRTHQFPTR